MLDISQIPSSITAHAPGYIDKDHEIIVGLQTEAPLKRAIMPNGGFRMVLERAQDLRLRARPARRRDVHQVPQDAQRGRVRRLHRRHPALPQLARPHRPARRLRPRPDHRRLPPRGALRRRPADRAEEAGEGGARSEPCRPTTIIRDREELAEQIRALEELKQMAASYGFDISGPARTAREAVQWLYFGYLAAVKEQNGAAMSLGRTLDVPRHLLRARSGGRRCSPRSRRRRSSTTSSSSSASSGSSARRSTTSCSPATRPG